MKRIIKELQKGNFVIVVDDKNREDESDLVIAGEFITPEKIAFMLDHCSGIICVSMTMEKIKKKGIPLVEKINFDYATAPFAFSVDAKGTHTGVSAYDRFLTIKKLCDDNASLKDFKIPGHVFPLYANPNGLKARKGHTEAAVELMKSAGLKEVAVICELMNTSANCGDKKKLGTMMRGKDVIIFSEKYDISFISINDMLK
ncbi:3,4-dihydroxy-2-butanone-4-phosphate synthase [Candidatus Woesearchaeota archaeon]|nr:3,4-dihydroxy-2-butanone-4-phosphate synthase [Candidatus Woesearchaeota archaeon]